MVGLILMCHSIINYVAKTAKSCKKISPCFFGVKIHVKKRRFKIKTTQKFGIRDFNVKQVKEISDTPVFPRGFNRIYSTLKLQSKLPQQDPSNAIIMFFAPLEMVLQ